MRRVFIFLTFLILTRSINCDAQHASWLQRSWQGKAYTLGNDPKSYDLILTINKVKGKNFEGVMTTIQSSDTSLRFNTKISGILNDNYLQINIPGWKVKCGNCAPQTLGFSMESGKFFMKGEAKGCYIECTWITVFSEDLMKFNTSDQEYLLAVSEKIESPEPDTTAVAQNTNPPKTDTVKATPKENVLVQRVPVLAAGNIVLIDHGRNTESPTKSSSLKNSASLIVKENVQEVKIPIIPAGDVALLNHDNNSLFRENTDL